MLDRIDKLCAERDRLKKEQRPVKGTPQPWEVVHGDRTSQMVRRECGKPAMGEGLGRGSTQGDARRLVLPHVQAIIVAIDEYAEAALGNGSSF
jgi:hypothetical protein